MNLNIPESEKTPLVIALLEIINEQRKEIETRVSKNLNSNTKYFPHFSEKT
jgi:hypothetical protein